MSNPLYLYLPPSVALVRALCSRTHVRAVSFDLFSLLCPTVWERTFTMTPPWGPFVCLSHTLRFPTVWARICVTFLTMRFVHVSFLHVALSHCLGAHLYHVPQHLRFSHCLDAHFYHDPPHGARSCVVFTRCAFPLFGRAPAFVPFPPPCMGLVRVSFSHVEPSHSLGAHLYLDLSTCDSPPGVVSILVLVSYHTHDNSPHTVCSTRSYHSHVYLFRTPVPLTPRCSRVSDCILPSSNSHVVSHRSSPSRPLVVVSLCPVPSLSVPVFVSVPQSVRILLPSS